MCSIAFHCLNTHKKTGALQPTWRIPSENIYNGLWVKGLNEILFWFTFPVKAVQWSDDNNNNNFIICLAQSLSCYWSMNRVRETEQGTASSTQNYCSINCSAEILLQKHYCFSSLILQFKYPDIFCKTCMYSKSFYKRRID